MVTVGAKLGTQEAGVRAVREVERSEVSRARTPAPPPVCPEESHSKHSTTSTVAGLHGFRVPRGGAGSRNKFRDQMRAMENAVQNG
ncbi:unnamed protein product [Gulo gulo]|uniref:Uncharacterized protein n=1 Tax=Gulo gulo TaxID=48420 RepID=A0A9X9Q4U6_GULGU|nr:unnamed protein product [Gulo gulo]